MAYRKTTQTNGEKFDAYAMVTERILAALDSNIVPWRKPWSTDLGSHRSMSTGKGYRGINPWLLTIAATYDEVPIAPGDDCGVCRGACKGAGRHYRLEPKATPYTSPFWGTFAQIKERGGMVRKGEHGTRVVFWKSYTKRETISDDDAGELISESSRFVLRYYTVFNADQCDGDLRLPALPEPRSNDPVAAADAIVAQYRRESGPQVIYAATDQASYNHMLDAVQIPNVDQYESTDAHYATLFHELTHSTGHHSRLERRAKDEHRAFGCEAYAKEELVAEMGSAMLCALSGIDPNIPQTAAYIAGWRKAIADDDHLIIGASAQAQRAADWIQGIRYGKSQATANLTVSNPADSIPSGISAQSEVA